MAICSASGSSPEDVGQPLVVHRLGDLVPALDRQLLQGVRHVGGVEVAVGRDQRLGALPGLRQREAVDLVPGELVQLAAAAQPARLLDGEPREHPVAGAGLLDAGVDDVRRPARLEDAHRAVEQLAEHQRLARPLLEALEVERAATPASPRRGRRRSPGPSARRSAGARPPRRPGPAPAARRVPTRSATTTSRTLPTRSPLGSKTVSPASRETYALVAVVTRPKATVGGRAGPEFLDYEVVDVFAPRAFAGNPLAVVFDADGALHRAVPGAGVRVPPLRDVVHLRAHRAGCRLPRADLHALRRAALRRAPERRGRAHAGAHRPAARRHAAPGVRRRRARPGGGRRRRDC